MYFTIISGDGMDMFEISTDKDTQEGVITVSKVRGNRTAVAHQAANGEQLVSVCEPGFCGVSHTSWTSGGGGGPVGLRDRSD